MCCREEKPIFGPWACLLVALGFPSWLPGPKSHPKGAATLRPAMRRVLVLPSGSRANTRSRNTSGIRAESLRCELGGCEHPRQIHGLGPFRSNLDVRGIPKCFLAKCFFGGLAYQGQATTNFIEHSVLFGLGTPGLQKNTWLKTNFGIPARMRKLQRRASFRVSVLSRQHKQAPHVEPRGG